MDEKTPRVFNRKLGARKTGNDEIGETRYCGGYRGPFGKMTARLDQDENAATVFHDYGDGYADEKKESESHATAPKHYASASRGSGYLNSPTSSTSTQKVSKPMYHHHQTTPVTKARTQKTSVRYKFANEPKSDEEIKKEKQRIWKQKLKIAQERKRRERQALDEGSESNFDGQAIISCVLENVDHGRFFEQFTTCGGVTGEDESESEGSSQGSSESSEEDECNAYSANTNGRKRGGQGVDPFSESSVESSTVDHSTVTSIKQDKRTILAKEKSIHADRKDAVNKETMRGSFIPQLHQANDSGVTPIHVTSMASNGANSSGTPELAASSLMPGHPKHGSPISSSIKAAILPSPVQERNFIKYFIDGMQSTGEHMLWHDEKFAMHPTDVTILLKKGHKCSNGTFCAPRLVWVGKTKDQNNSVDLFDIQSLNRADAFELTQLPLAIPSRSFRMQLSNGRSFIFEAATDDDAWRFIRGLRWVVARLAFNLAIGNLDVSCELLDFGFVEGFGKSRSALMEFNWSRAMDDVTDQLVEKSFSSSMNHV
jgi:hypothetical protein